MSYPRQANQDEVLADFIKPWIANGRELERAAIVAWLRSQPLVVAVGQDNSRTFAHPIESGEHLRGDDE